MCAFDGAYTNPAGLFFFMSPPTRKGGQERENPMKRLLFVIVLVIAGRVWAVAPIGPAASTLEKGQLELGFDYARTKFHDLSGRATVKVSGSPVPGKLQVDDTVNGYWAEVGYGLFDPLDVFLRLGAADLEFAGPEFAWGLGGRVTIAESERLDWGLLAQASWFGGTKEQTISTPEWGLVRQRDYLDCAVFQIAAGPVYKGDGLSVYGGPFLYWLCFDGASEATVLSNGVPINSTIDGETDVQFGGYVGLSVDLADRLSVRAEAQLAADSETFVFDLTWRF